MNTLDRRHFLKSGLLAAAGASLAACVPMARLRQTDQYQYTLTLEPAPFELIPGTQTPGLGFNGQYPSPILRAKQGQPLTVTVINKLDQPTTIHWHGIRIDIAMDGVPFLSQKPIMPGERFVYRFTPPDAGTFWYHPHVNSVEQLGKGLVGMLLVEEADSPDFSPSEFAADLPLMLKNWHLNDDGSFKPLTIPRYAARMGTPGNYETINGLHKPEMEVPANRWVRLRFANVDNTVMYKLRIKNRPAFIASIDANPLPRPKKLKHHTIGAGMRVDIVLKTPPAGEEVIIQNGKGKLFFDFMRLKTVQARDGLTGDAPMPRLPLNPLPEPDLANAETKRFVFEWEGAVTPADDQGKANHKFWTINRRAWEGMSADNIPAPLATLDLGKSYVFDLKNNTPHAHPIHIHGVMFKVIKSNKKRIEPFFTDTVLMAKNERVKIAFVADNPGRWMYHCHVIEHMKTGLMGYIEIR
ncbi:multicopper oxidase family protein [Pseudomaricurvus alkylphenolicus]|uniref:multicopper oxidase family protein n=1 Tax=Pseudomaricurvus alkylphenolicus TaxID=1306991 RepID=UPI0014220BB1|nr:multicopper oxidase family protein [Pseudomaricurvus alkylphenolicus]NIB39902.1 multicopper oxidase family protein [Pseudomaricurvus alkylphenolicus]